jgi:transposase-like protein
MPIVEIDRLSGTPDGIDLSFPERERTPEEIVEVGIQLDLILSLFSNTIKYYETVDVQRSRTAIHDRMHKTTLHPATDAEPKYIAVDETVIQVDDQRHWLYATVDLVSHLLLHVRLFDTRTSRLTIAFLRERAEKHDLIHTTILVDDAHHR